MVSYASRNVLILFGVALLLFACARPTSGLQTTPSTILPASPTPLPTATSHTTKSPSTRPTDIALSESPVPSPTLPGPVASGLVDAVITMPTNIGQAYWSPNGTVLALTDGKSVFLARKPDFHVQDVFQFPQPLANPMFDQNLIWSFSGAFLAVLNRQQLWVIEVATGRIIVDTPLSTEKMSDFQDILADWSSDDASLIYNDSRGLGLVELSTGEHQSFFATQDPASPIARSPSGKLLAFTTRWPHDTGVYDLYVLDQQGNLVCLWPIQNGWAGGVNRWLDNEALVWGERCGSGCSYMGILDIASCQETLFTGFGYDYRWNSDANYVAITVDGHSDQAYLMDREGNCWPLGDSPNPGGSCVEPSGCIGCPASKHHLVGDWSPNGRHLLLNSRDYELPSAPACNLWMVTVPELVHTHLLSETCEARWSPDGQLISFRTQGQPIRNVEGQVVGVGIRVSTTVDTEYVGVLDISTWQIPLLLPSSDYGGWSPNSQYLLVEDGIPNLHLWRRSDNTTTIIYQGSGPHNLEYLWSPDSTAIWLSSKSQSWIAHLKQ